MEVIKKEITFPSVTGLTDIRALSWAPKDPSNVKGVVQVEHGMAEHIDRYDGFATYLASNGYAVFADDHIGHGKSVKSDAELGYFGENNYAGDAFIEDCKQLQDIAMKEYPNLPYIFFGHSMGSFIARKFSAKYGNTLTGAIFCGSAYTNPAAPIAIKMAEKIVASKGAFCRSEKLNNLAFMGYNKKTEKRTGFDWLTRNEEIVDEYIADDKCGFIFTALGFRDLFTLLDSVSQTSWYESVPVELPLFVISGGMDPVGGYGKGVNKFINKLRKTGHKVSENIYLYGRHEILNETNNDEVFADVLEWIEETIKEN